jgi:hypothetical protein
MTTTPTGSVVDQTVLQEFLGRAVGDLGATLSAALVVEDGPAFAGSMQLALGVLRDVPAIEERFRTGAGFGWHEHDADLFEGTERFFRPGYVANLVSQGSRRAAEVARHAAAAISPIMAPYQPVVVFLAAMTPARSR